MTPVPSALSGLEGLATDPMQAMSAANAIPTPAGAIISVAGKVISGLGRVGAARATAQSQINQLNNNIAALMEEKAYNVENYKQFIADQLASNKMSFYASGLDYRTGTASDVIEANREASTADMNMMIKNYDTQIKNLKTQRKEAEKSKQYAWTNFF